MLTQGKIKMEQFSNIFTYNSKQTETESAELNDDENRLCLTISPQEQEFDVNNVDEDDELPPFMDAIVQVGCSKMIDGICQTDLKKHDIGIQCHLEDSSEINKNDNISQRNAIIQITPTEYVFQANTEQNSPNSTSEDLVFENFINHIDTKVVHDVLIVSLTFSNFLTQIHNLQDMIENLELKSFLWHTACRKNCVEMKQSLLTCLKQMQIPLHIFHQYQYLSERNQKRLIDKICEDYKLTFTLDKRDYVRNFFLSLSSLRNTNNFGELFTKENQQQQQQQVSIQPQQQVKIHQQQQQQRQQQQQQQQQQPNQYNSTVNDNAQNTVVIPEQSSFYTINQNNLNAIYNNNISSISNRIMADNNCIPTVSNLSSTYNSNATYYAIDPIIATVENTSMNYAQINNNNYYSNNTEASISSQNVTDKIPSINNLYSNQTPNYNLNINAVIRPTVYCENTNNFAISNNHNYNTLTTLEQNPYPQQNYSTTAYQSTQLPQLSGTDVVMTLGTI